MSHLKQLLSKITGNHIYIQTHNFPDADAISSAFGLQYLLKQSGVSSTICYGGKIDRSCIQNMLDKLDIALVNIRDIHEPQKDSQTLLIDSQEGNSNIITFSNGELMCIDHHPVFEEHDYSYKDIRPDVGACASIIASYFFEAGYEIPKNVATAILYGIKIDTANFTRGASALDLDVFHKIYDTVDLKLVRSFDMSSLQLTDLSSYVHAINNINTFGDVSFTSTGLYCPEALIANISDFMLSLSEISLSIVYSIRDEGIKLSIRSDTSKYDAGLIINKALKGIGNGGGHSSMAGGFVEFEDNPTKGREELIKDIERRIMAIINK